MSDKRTRRTPNPRALRVRDPKLLVLLRQALPEAKGRAGRHLSQRQAAAAIGINYSYLARIETGDQVSLRVAEAIAHFYDVDVDALFATHERDEVPA